MVSALPSAPLCVAVYANSGEGWNTAQPPIPNPPEPPCHGVLNYLIDPYSNTWIHDDYQPNPKELVYGWPIPQCLQAIVTVVPPPPAPPVPLPTPATPATPTSPAQPVTVQEYSNWLTAILKWLSGILSTIQGAKGRKKSQ